MIGLTLDDRAQAQARQCVRGRIGLGRTLGQLEQFLGRSRLDFPETARHGSPSFCSGRAIDHFGKRNETRGAIRVDRSGQPLANRPGGRLIAFLANRSARPLSWAPSFARIDRLRCFQLASGARAQGGGRNLAQQGKDRRSSPSNSSLVPRSV